MSELWLAICWFPVGSCSDGRFYIHPKVHWKMSFLLSILSSLPFRSVVQSICYVSCRLQLISLEGSDSYIGFTHDSSRQREHWGAGLILSCAPADIKELLYLISLKHLQSQRTDKYRKIQQNQSILKGKMKRKIKSPRFLKWLEVHIQ